MSFWITRASPLRVATVPSPGWSSRKPLGAGQPAHERRARAAGRSPPGRGPCAPSSDSRRKRRLEAVELAMGVHDDEVEAVAAAAARGQPRDRPRCRSSSRSGCDRRREAVEALRRGPRRHRSRRPAAGRASCRPPRTPAACSASAPGIEQTSRRLARALRRPRGRGPESSTPLARRSSRRSARRLHPQRPRPSAAASAGT